MGSMQEQMKRLKKKLKDAEIEQRIVEYKKQLKDKKNGKKSWKDCIQRDSQRC